MTKISIIIPVKEINAYVRDFNPIIQNQSFKDFEIIILPDTKTNDKFPKTRIIPTGHLGPAQKRDIGVREAKGEIIAFIDDDAYPERDWLKNAIKIFVDKKVAAVGGPNMTPKESNFFQKVSGEVLASYLVSGPVRYRYKKCPQMECDDLPSCNLLIRRKVFLELGGFDTSFWPGEDTKLCRDIKTSCKKIIYDPNVAVYHHRRENLSGYLKQIYSYALHRGFFAKKYPETSLKLSYFIPTLFLLGLILGPILSIFSNAISAIYLSVLVIYLILLFIEALKPKKLSYIIPFMVLAFVTHIIYGYGVLVGFIKKDLSSKYRK